MRQVFVFFVLFSLLFDHISAQSKEETLSNLKSQLYNNGKPWIMDKEVEFYMSSEPDPCDGEQIYVFKTNSDKVKFMECVDNKWVVQKLTWNLEAENELDAILKFSNGKSYYIKFLKKDGRDKLRLRKLSEKSKKIVDYYFNAR